VGGAPGIFSARVLDGPISVYSARVAALATLAPRGYPATRQTVAAHCGLHFLRSKCSDGQAGTARSDAVWLLPPAPSHQHSACQPGVRTAQVAPNRYCRWVLQGVASLVGYPQTRCGAAQSRRHPSHCFPLALPMG
jgi:hypothetical protein